MQVDATKSIQTDFQTTNLAPQKKEAVGRDDFLALLIAQLKNQSPFSPVEDKEFIAQMAQFSVLQQVQDLNERTAALITLEQMTQAYSLIGRTVETSPDISGEVLTGVVTGVDLTGETVGLTINGKRVNVVDIARVT